MRFCDEDAAFFGWVADDESLRRASHALVADGGVWLVDPLAWPDAERRVREVGEPRGVIQLLDRHERDAREIASRIGVPLHVVPCERIDGAPFDFLCVVRMRFWRESALWWPEQRVLVCADAIGTVGYFRAANEPLGVHPFLRVTPPKQLRTVFPEHVLVGHGEGVHGERASLALHAAIRTSRRRLPRALLSR